MPATLQRPVAAPLTEALQTKPMQSYGIKEELSILGDEMIRLHAERGCSHEKILEASTIAASLAVIKPGNWVGEPAWLAKFLSRSLNTV